MSEPRATDAFEESTPSFAYGAEVPHWTARKKSEPAAAIGLVGSRSRRDVLRYTLYAGILGMGLRALDPFGGRSPAEAGMTCSTSGLTYRSNCNGSGGYPASCSDGCPRPSSTDSSFFCISSTYGSRHRTCGEPRWSSSAGTYYYFQIRTDDCYGGGYDGWKWEGVDSGGDCGCANVKQFSCNDGWYKVGTAGTYAASICQTSRCV